mgnify:CR=1 FL=1
MILVRQVELHEESKNEIIRNEAKCDSDNERDANTKLIDIELLCNRRADGKNVNNL